jgi:hypothetical protein
MSTQPVLYEAALRRHFLFVPGQTISVSPVRPDPPAISFSAEVATLPKKSSLVFQHLAKMPQLAAVTPASRLEIRSAPELVSAGIPEVDMLAGGLPRGCLTEICGPASSGRTSLMLAALAAATQRQEVCALVDPCDALDPQSAIDAGIDLKRLLWVRCSTAQPIEEENADPQNSHARRKQNYREPGRKFHSDKNSRAKTDLLTAEGNPGKTDFTALDNVLRVTDLLLQSSGFGMVVVDLSNIPLKAARRIPLTSWFRFRRAVEKTSTVLLVIEQKPIAGSCSSLLLSLESTSQAASRNAEDSRPATLTQEEIPSHSQLLEGFRIHAEILRLQWKRKPPQSVRAAFETTAAWAARP